MKQYNLCIDGKWVEPQSGKSFAVHNPATGELVGEVADAGKEDVNAAIAAAYRALPQWAERTAHERSEILRKAYELMIAHQEELAVLMTTEQGKPLAEARGEVQYAADFFAWYSEEAKRIYGETIPASSSQKRIWVLHQPVGVVAAITPWNFPAAMITRKIAPALAAGCSVVVKPAEQTPLTACRLMELFLEAGVPAGVINLVTGSNPDRIGHTLLQDQRVRKVTFTGSTAVGKKIMRQAADTVKKVSLELGGHAPFLIFADADLKKAAREVVASKFRNAGQTCVCTNRIFVHESIVDDFAKELTDLIQSMKVGNGMEEGVTIGPLISKEAADKVEHHVQDAVAKGAAVLAGGRRRSQFEGEVHFFEPTVLTHVTDEMLVLQEETFGPVAPLQTFQTEEEVLEKANNTPYGLAAYLYTRDLSRAIRVSEQLEYGIVGVNDGLPSVVQAPFGGWKESGLGREGGKYGIEEFLETKYISVGLV